MSELYRIETKAKDYAECRQELSDIMTTLKAEVDAIYAEARRDVRRVLGKVAQRESELKQMIQDNPALFQPPAHRTLTFSGVKVGYRTGGGGISWEDADEVVRLIEKHFPDLADTAIKTEKTPRKKVLEAWPASDLKKVSVSVEGNGEIIVVKSVDGAVEKAVKALLKNSADELAEEAA